MSIKTITTRQTVFRRAVLTAVEQKKNIAMQCFSPQKCTRRVQRHTDRHEVRHDGSPCRFVVRSMLGSTVPGPCVAAARHDTGVWRTGMSTVPAAPPIKYVLGYRSRTLTLNPNPNPNLTLKLTHTKQNDIGMILNIELYLKVDFLRTGVGL